MDRKRFMEGGLRELRKAIILEAGFQLLSGQETREEFYERGGDIRWLLEALTDPARRRLPANA